MRAPGIIHFANSPSAICSLPGGVRIQLRHSGHERHEGRSGSRFAHLTEHTHKALHLIMFLKGENQYRLDGQVVSWCAPHGVLIDSDVPHVVLPIVEGTIEYLQVTFSVLDAEGKECAMTWPDLTEAVGGAPFSSDTVKAQTWQRVTPDGFAAVDAALNEDLFLFGARFLTLLGMLGQEPPRMTPEPLERVQEKIASHPSHPWTVDELAGICHWSKGYFQRNCRKHLDCTPMELVYQYRLQKACALLVEGNLTLDVIAEVCGFVDAYHFSRRFKQEKGLPPGAWRRSMVP